MQEKNDFSSHPVPIEYDSMLNSLENGKSKPIDTVMQLSINYLSNWKSGKSQYLSANSLSDKLGISTSYVRKVLNRAKKWLKKIGYDQRGTRYQVIKHDIDKCDPDERKFCSMPHGFGSCFEKMFRGEISWRACLVWIMLKTKSDWTTGVTERTSMHKIAKLCKISVKHVSKAISELKESGLLERITPSHIFAQYQLLPKPKAKKKKKDSDSDISKNSTPHHVYSDNWQYRLSRKDGTIEKRTGYREWKRVSDYQKTLIPVKIIEFFEFFIVTSRWKQQSEATI